MNGIDVRHLTVSYGGEPAVRDVSFHAPAGSVTGLIGPNGAGKSTVVRALLGLLAPDSGTVSIDGHDPNRRSRRHVAYVPQSAQTDASYPIQVGELVMMGRLPHRGLWRRTTAEDRAAAATAIERAGLNGLEQHQLGALPDGQQQRAHLARALVQQPTTYILDEPLAGIDAPTSRLVVDVLSELAAAGATVLLVDHDMKRLAQACDRVVVLRTSVMAQGMAGDVLGSVAMIEAYTSVRGAVR